jgi:hypothetical protein
MYVFFLTYVDFCIINKIIVSNSTLTPDIVELELPTLPFPIAGPNTSNKDKGLQRSKKIRQTDRKNVIGWAVEDVPTGQKWEFSEDTS